LFNLLHCSEGVFHLESVFTRVHFKEITGMTIRVFIVVLAMLFVSTPAWGQSDTSFTYQGVLQDGGGPADGAYDLSFQLFDAGVGGNSFGFMLNFIGHQVTDGLFEIELDFAAVPLGAVGSRWLEITVNGVTLSPRKQITASPYSIQTRGIFVNNSKNVGIGTETPLGLLHLRKQTRSFFIPERMLVIDSHDDPNDFDLGSGSGSGILFKVPYQSDSRVGAAIDAVRTTPTEVDSSTALVFSTSANSQTLNEAMRIDDAGVVYIPEKLAIGTSSDFLFAPFTSIQTGTLLPNAIDAQSDHSSFPTISARNTGSGPVLWASGSSDVSLGGGGVILIGAEAGANLTMDRNEIMARNNGAPAGLFLNFEGGEVAMGEHRMHPAYAYGRVNGNGTLSSGSSNIQNITKISDGVYHIEIEGGVQSGDIVIASSTGGLVSVGGQIDVANQHIRITEIFLPSGDPVSFPVKFVVYRP
jgi:hypothetical protein